MYTKYISLYYGTYLLYCLRYCSSVNCIRFPMKCCISGRIVIILTFSSAKLLKFEIQKCGQILCAHKPYFLMPGHIYAIKGMSTTPRKMAYCYASIRRYMFNKYFMVSSRQQKAVHITFHSCLIRIRKNNHVIIRIR